MPLPLSVVDFATVRRGASVREGLAGSVRLAQHAERLGYRRVWYSEHHNMATIASSAPAVLIAHVAADRTEDALAQLAAARRERVRAMVGRDRELGEAELDMVMDSPAAQQVLHMMRWSTAGTGPEVRSWLEGFAATADADELMIAPGSPGEDEALRSLEILAHSWGEDTEEPLPHRASRR